MLKYFTAYRHIERLKQLVTETPMPTIVHETPRLMESLLAEIERLQTARMEDLKLLEEFESRLMSGDLAYSSKLHARVLNALDRRD